MMDPRKYKEHAEALDREDSLASFRQRFRLPHGHGAEKTYFLGNSLGLQPVAARGAVDAVLGEWEEHGVEAFFEGEDPWMKKQEQLAVLMAPIVGARPSEVSIQDALTINLHLLFSTFYKPSGRRTRILCEAKAFPSDQYMMHAQVAGHGLDPGNEIIEVGPREGEATLRHEDIINAIKTYGDELALVFFGGVNYYTGQLLDIASITRAAHEAGAIAGFDLAHAAGNMDLELHDWNVDFAAWCNYKYLNGGPGAIASLFVHETHHETSLPRPGGWWGNDAGTRFLMEKEFRPATGAAGWQVGTPPALLMATLLASLKIFDEAGWKNIQNKRGSLGAFLDEVLDDIMKRYPGEVQCLTPAATAGCQRSLFLPQFGKDVFNRLTGKGIMTDWREPGVVRVAPVPLYNTHQEIFRLYQTLEEALATLKT